MSERVGVHLIPQPPVIERSEGFTVQTLSSDPHVVERLYEYLTFAPHVGDPIPLRRKPDGFVTSTGFCLSVNGELVGYIWKEWPVVDGFYVPVHCCCVFDSFQVTRSRGDIGATGVLLVDEWRATKSAN